MRDRGWSEGELARRSGVQQPTIHRIITGETKSPRRDKIERIAKAFGKQVEDAYDAKSKPATVRLEDRADDAYEHLASLSDEQRELVLRIVAEFSKAR